MGVTLMTRAASPARNSDLGREAVAASSDGIAFENGLLAVILVPLAADLDEPEPGDQTAGRQILRAYCRTEPEDGGVALCPVEHGEHGFSRVPQPAIGANTS